MSVPRYLDGTDASSTGNMWRHTKVCPKWGKEVLEGAKGLNHENAREYVTKLLRMTGSVQASFAIKGKGKVTYSNVQHTKTQTKYVDPLAKVKSRLM